MSWKGLIYLFDSFHSIGLSYFNLSILERMQNSQNTAEYWNKGHLQYEIGRYTDYYNTRTGNSNLLKKFTYPINFTFLYLKNEMYQIAIFFKNKNWSNWLIYDINLFQNFDSIITYLWNKVCLGQKLFLILKSWKCISEILENALFQKRILNKKVIIKNKLTYKEVWRCFTDWWAIFPVQKGLKNDLLLHKNRLEYYDNCMSDVLIHHHSIRSDGHVPAFSEKCYPKKPKACHFPEFLTFFPAKS